MPFKLTPSLLLTALQPWTDVVEPIYKRVAEMVEAVLTDRKHLAPCAAYLRGEYGIENLFIGVPVILGSNGIERIIELNLTDDEREELAVSAAAVKKGVDELSSFFSPT